MVFSYVLLKKSLTLRYIVLKYILMKIYDVFFKKLELVQGYVYDVASLFPILIWFLIGTDALL